MRSPQGSDILKYRDTDGNSLKIFKITEPVSERKGGQRKTEHWLPKREELYLKARTKMRILVWMLICTMLFQNVAYAGEWKQENTDWYYEQDGVRQKGWVSDETGRYLLDDNGKLQSGWHLDGQTWYFLNTAHDGYFGRALTGQWVWIDGYCYLFDTEGKMYANCTTPDGYEVNADGRWTVDGVVQYVEGKGILTAPLAAGNGAANPFSGGGSGGGGGGGGGGSHSGGSSGGSSSGSGNQDSITFPEYEGVEFDGSVTMQTLEFADDPEAGIVTVLDQTEVQNWKAGEIRILHDEESPWNDIAIRVTGVEETDSGAVVHYEQPLLEEVVDSIHISGVVESGGEFIPAEGVTVQPAARAMARSRESGTFNGIGGPIALTYSKNGIKVEGSFLLNRLFYDYQAETIDGEFQIERCTMEIDAEADLMFSALKETDFDPDKKRERIPLGEIKIPFGSIPGFLAGVSIGLEPSLVGGGTIGGHFDLKAGIILEEDGEWTPLFESDPSLNELELYGSARLMFVAGFPLSFLGLKLSDVGGKIGIGLDGEAKPIPGGLFQFCLDGKFHFLGSVYAELSKVLSAEWALFDIPDPPPSIHIEETGIVKECTRKGEINYSYKGTVIDAETGDPIDQARVELLWNGSIPEVLYTGADGRFGGLSLVSTDHKIRVTSNGYVPCEMDVMSQSGEISDLVIELTPDGKLKGGWSVTATDYYNNGIPVPKAKVDILQDGVLLLQYTTDENGFCKGKDLTEGTYTLRVSKEKYRIYETTFTVEREKENDLNVSMMLIGAGFWTVQITVKATNITIPNATITVSREGESEILDEATSDENGICKGNVCLPNGTYTLSVFADGYDDVEVPLEITDETEKNLQITMVKTQTMVSDGWEAYVTDAETGKPISQALVWLLAEDVMDSVYTKNNGYCVNQNPLDPGEYRVWVRADSYETYVDTVVIPESGTAECSWKLQPYRKSGIVCGVRGYTICSEDRSWYVPNAKVEFYSGGQLVKTVYSDTKGYFECELSEGEYSMRVSADGYVTKETSAVPTSLGDFVHEINLEIEKYPVTFNIKTGDGDIPDTMEVYFDMVEGKYWLDNHHFGSLEKEGDTFKAELWYGTYMLNMDSIYVGENMCESHTKEVTIDKTNESNAVFDVTLTVIPQETNALLLSLEIPEEPMATPSDLPETDLDKDDDDEKQDTVLNSEEPANPAEKPDGGAEPEDPEAAEKPETGELESDAGEDEEEPEPDSGKDPDAESDPDAGEPSGEEGDLDEVSEPEEPENQEPGQPSEPEKPTEPEEPVSEESSETEPEESEIEPTEET